MLASNLLEHLRCPRFRLKNTDSEENEKAFFNGQSLWNEIRRGVGGERLEIEQQSTLLFQKNSWRIFIQIFMEIWIGIFAAECCDFDFRKNLNKFSQNSLWSEWSFQNNFPPRATNDATSQSNNLFLILLPSVTYSNESPSSLKWASECC